MRQLVLYNPATRMAARFGWGGKLVKAVLALGQTLKIITSQPDRKKCKVRRAQVLWEEAEKRGILMKELLLFGKPFDCYVAEKQHPSSSKIKDEGSRIIFSGLPRPAGYINPWLDLMDDKWLFKKKLMAEGLPVPIGASCRSWGQAKQIFDKIQHQHKNEGSVGESANRRIGLPVSVIVKPRAGSRGRHSTTFVTSLEELKISFRIAKQLCYWVMVEQQLMGPVYRGTVINFELAGVLRGDAPQIISDGENVINKLIEFKNQELCPGVKNIQADQQMERFLGRQNLTLTSVLPVGQTIYLSEKIGVNYGGSSSEDFAICHPDNRELFERAAKVLGDPLAGFDFIIPDIGKSWREQKCGFIEVNSLPFINLHHDPLLGAPRNVAGKVWDMLD